MTSRTSVGALLVASLLTGHAASEAQTGPAPTASRLPPDVLALACAPRADAMAPETPLRVTGGQDTIVRSTYHPGDLITINAGSEHGIQVGDEYYTRRTERTRQAAKGTSNAVRTSGWIRIYAVDDEMSLATITHACDVIEVNDRLEPFALPTPLVFALDQRKPERDNYGHVMTGADHRTTFAKGDFLILDRGTTQGVTPGSQFVIYRNKEADGNFLFDLGEAVAVAVTADAATLQVIVSRGAIQTGDLVAIRK